jgi:hypothetical protein
VNNATLQDVRRERAPVDESLPPVACCLLGAGSWLMQMQSNGDGPMKHPIEETTRSRNDVCPRCSALLAAIFDECQCNAYCRAMPSTRTCGACGRRCRCACRHRRNLCITSCSAARRQLARRRQCDARQASVLLAQFGVSFDPFGGAKSRVTVSAYSASASRRSSAATRTRGAGRVLPSLRWRCARTRRSIRSTTPARARRRTPVGA